MNSLTLDELEQFEDKAGVSFDALTTGTPPIRAVRALVWLVRRREDAEVTWEQVGQTKLAEVVMDFEEDPTSAVD